MGIGRFDETTHKFNLLLSVRYDATADLNQWQRTFQRASELLYDATDGKHQLGTVHVCLNSLGGDAADAWLLGTAGTPHSGGYATLGTSSAGVHITLGNGEIYHPLQIVHELGHYIYGLRDEYLIPGVSEKCLGHTGADGTGSALSNACIMEANQTDGDQWVTATDSWSAGDISEFCSADHTLINEQQSVNMQSCWDTMEGGAVIATSPSLMMSSGYHDLSPVPTAPGETAPTGADQIGWVVLESTQRFVLVIDRSGSMMGDKLTEAKFGADWWADALLIGDAFAVVSYSDTPSDVFPLTPLMSDTDRAMAHTNIGLIEAGGATSIGGGLRRAYEILEAAGSPTVTESIVLLTDGIHNTGEHPSTVLPDLIARGVRVFTIGIGSGVASTLLNQIATATGGAYYVA
jgi:hypothetical protein